MTLSLKQLDERLKVIEEAAEESQAPDLWDGLDEQLDNLTLAVATALVTTGSNGALRVAQAICDRYLPGQDAKTLRTDILTTAKDLNSA